MSAQNYQMDLNGELVPVVLGPTNAWPPQIERIAEALARWTLVIYEPDDPNLAYIWQPNDAGEKPTKSFRVIFVQLRGDGKEQHIVPAGGRLIVGSAESLRLHRVPAEPKLPFVLLPRKSLVTKKALTQFFELLSWQYEVVCEEQKRQAEVWQAAWHKWGSAQARYEQGLRKTQPKKPSGLPCPFAWTTLVGLAGDGRRVCGITTKRVRFLRMPRLRVVVHDADPLLLGCFEQLTKITKQIYEPPKEEQRQTRLKKRLIRLVYACTSRWQTKYPVNRIGRIVGSRSMSIPRASKLCQYQWVDTARGPRRRRVVVGYRWPPRIEAMLSLFKHEVFDRFLNPKDLWSICQALNNPYCLLVPLCQSGLINHNTLTFCLRSELPRATPDDSRARFSMQNIKDLLQISAGAWLKKLGRMTRDGSLVFEIWFPEIWAKHQPGRYSRRYR